MLHSLIFLGICLLSTIKATEFDPRFPDQVPEKCSDDPNFCLTYCLTIDPDTVRARCGKDLISCVCTNRFQNSVKVRFVQERQPVSSTTTTPAPPPPTFDYPPAGPVPQLLHCDASAEAESICNNFCQTNIYALRGVCDPLDYSCRCEGVPPAVVKPAPIPAIFYPSPTAAYEPPTTQIPIPEQFIPQQQIMPTQQNIPASFWNPITPQHPNYYQSNANTFYSPPSNTLQNPTMQQYQNPAEIPSNQYFIPYQPMQYYVPMPSGYVMANGNDPGLNGGIYAYPEMSPVTHSDGYHTLREDLNMSTIPISETTVPSPSVEPEVDMNIGEASTTDVKVHSQVSTKVSVSEQLSDGTVENLETESHRKKRSPIPTGFFSSFSSSSSSSCSTKTCKKACKEDGFGSKRCKPTCLDTTCVCVCQPKISSEKVIGGDLEGVGDLGELDITGEDGSSFSQNNFQGSSIKESVQQSSDSSGFSTGGSSSYSTVSTSNTVGGGQESIISNAGESLTSFLPGFMSGLSKVTKPVTEGSSIKEFVQQTSDSTGFSTGGSSSYSTVSTSNTVGGGQESIISNAGESLTSFLPGLMPDLSKVTKPVTDLLGSMKFPQLGNPQQLLTPPPPTFTAPPSLQFNPVPTFPAINF